jgi:tRNA modification GTPase
VNASAPTTAGLLTPLAPGGIAVIRLAGPATDDILRKILRRRRTDGTPPLHDRRPVFCRIADGPDIIDDALVVRTSRQGIVSAELCTHGGVRIAQRTLLLLERLGAEIVDGLSFASALGPTSAVEHAIDLALLSAASGRLARWLLAQRSILPPVLERLDALSAGQRSAFNARSEVARRLLAGLHVAIVGPPNAGKSSLANRLVGKDRSITSAEAGTTRDWIDETALVQGWPITLTDTAGIRETSCEIETEALRRGRARAHDADLILVVTDAATPAETQRRQVRDITESLPADRPTLLAANKCDLPAAAPASGPGLAAIQVSALTGQGIEKLERSLAAALSLDTLDDALPTALSPEMRPPD